MKHLDFDTLWKCMCVHLTIFPNKCVSVSSSGLPASSGLSWDKLNAGAGNTWLCWKCRKYHRLYWGYHWLYLCTTCGHASSGCSVGTTGGGGSGCMGGTCGPPPAILVYFKIINQTWDFGTIENCKLIFKLGCDFRMGVCFIFSCSSFPL